MRILIADKFEDSGLQALTGAGHQVAYEPGLSPETIAEAIGRTGPEVLVVRSTKVPAEAIKAGADSLKGIIRAGSGHDNIDSAAAGELGIPVANCPGMNAVAVAELTIGHMISLDRRLPEQHDALRDGMWNKKEFSVARGLKGQSMLVVGMGGIGIEVITRAKAFGIRITAQSRSLTRSVAKAIGVEPLKYTREDLLGALPRMDIVSMHVPSTPESRGMCDKEFFEAMRPGAMFINTSRGEVVDEAALVAAVKSKGIRAAVDVYQDQPSFKDGAWETPLASVWKGDDAPGGVYFSHHCGASTDQAQFAVAMETVRLVNHLSEHGELENCVNEELLASRV